MDNKEVNYSFYWRVFGLPWEGWLFKDTHFIFPLGLEANDPLNLPIVQVLNN